MAPAEFSWESGGPAGVLWASPSTWGLHSITNHKGIGLCSLWCLETLDWITAQIREGQDHRKGSPCVHEFIFACVPGYVGMSVCISLCVWVYTGEKERGGQLIPGILKVYWFIFLLPWGYNSEFRILLSGTPQRKTLIDFLISGCYRCLIDSSGEGPPLPKKNFLDSCRDPPVMPILAKAQNLINAIHLPLKGKANRLIIHKFVFWEQI